MDWYVKEGVLQIHTTEKGVFLYPLPNLPSSLHTKLVFFDRFVEPLEVQDWPKLARAASLGHSKI